MDAAPWTRVLDAVPVTARDELADRIARELAAARVRWPAAIVTDAAVADALASRISTQRDPSAALARLRIDDFLLAQWCASGDPGAIVAFERAHQVDLDAVVGRFRRLPVSEDELRQALRIKLFVGEHGRPPRIGDYSGFGFLQNWLRVT